MGELLSDSTVRLVLWSLVLMFLLVVSYYGVSKLRGGDDQDQESGSDLLTKFRQMHAEGELSDEEYRTIKTQLGKRMHRELNDSGEKG